MDLFMVAFIDRGGLSSAGVYTMAFYMVSIIEIPMRAILNVAAPKIAEAAKHGDTKRVEEVYRLVAFYQLLSGLLIFAMIWVNIDNIFGIRCPMASSSPAVSGSSSTSGWRSSSS